ncbi:MAG: hypothetical protein ACYTEQ_29040 [Planctomycetota bacterium]
MSVAITPEEQAAIDAQKQAEAEAAERARATGQPQPQRQTPLVVRPPWRTRMLRFLTVVTGGKVDGETWRKRVAICVNCSKHEEVQYKYKVRLYCGMCGCPRWWWSELKKANQYKLWTCNWGDTPDRITQAAVRAAVGRSWRGTITTLVTVAGRMGISVAGLNPSMPTT